MAIDLLHSNGALVAIYSLRQKRELITSSDTVTGQLIPPPNFAFHVEITYLKVPLPDLDLFFRRFGFAASRVCAVRRWKGRHRQDPGTTTRPKMEAEMRYISARARESMRGNWLVHNFPVCCADGRSGDTMLVEADEGR